MTFGVFGSFFSAAGPPVNSSSFHNDDIFTGTQQLLLQYRRSPLIQFNCVLLIIVFLFECSYFLEHSQVDFDKFNVTCLSVPKSWNCTVLMFSKKMPIIVLDPTRRITACCNVCCLELHDILPYFQKFAKHIEQCSGVRPSLNEVKKYKDWGYLQSLCTNKPNIAVPTVRLPIGSNFASSKSLNMVNEDRFYCQLCLEVYAFANSAKKHLQKQHPNNNKKVRSSRCIVALEIGSKHQHRLVLPDADVLKCWGQLILEVNQITFTDKLLTIIFCCIIFSLQSLSGSGGSEDTNYVTAADLENQRISLLNIINLRSQPIVQQPVRPPYSNRDLFANASSIPASPPIPIRSEGNCLIGSRMEVNVPGILNLPIYSQYIFSSGVLTYIGTCSMF